MSRRLSQAQAIKALRELAERWPSILANLAGAKMCKADLSCTDLCLACGTDN